MMRFDIISIFPEFFDGPLDYGILRRAREAKLVDVHVQDLREFALDRHHTVDDRPFGGGEGMVLKPEPLFDAVEALLGATISGSQTRSALDDKTAIVLLSAAGKLFRQGTARRFATLDRVIFICGRYEGVDERVAEHLATNEISIGDYVLTGGELPAALIVDAVTRLLPGALGNENSAVHESFSAPHDQANLPGETARQLSDGESLSVAEGKMDDLAPNLDSVHFPAGLLDYPHYTRPAEYRGWAVPQILLSGNHAEIRRWRREKAFEKTLRNRPDLLRKQAGEPDAAV